MTVIQTLIQKDKAIARKSQRFDAVCSAPAEQEQAVFVDLISVLKCDDLRQSVNSAAKVGVAAGDVVVLDIRQIDHGCFKKDTAAATTSGFVFIGISTVVSAVLITMFCGAGSVTYPVGGVYCTSSG